MSAKRALIVDDSRSARAFLSRILERYDLQVDGAASAEEALEYLTRARPDVIFMDHLMPGMDGFQALTAIKNDPRTAMIPIMMYTSQEGELYLSQARALGALGVLPKQTKPMDVSRALEQLHLLGESAPVAATGQHEQRVREAGSAFEPARLRDEAAESLPPLAAGSASGALVPGGLSAEARREIESLLHDHAREMRRLVNQNLEKHSARVVAELRSVLSEGAATPGAVAIGAGAPGTEVRRAAYASGIGRGRALLWLGTAAVLIVLLAGTFWLVSWWLSGAAHRSGLPTVEASAPAVQPPATPPVLPRAVPAGSTAASAAAFIDVVPLGESPLSGARTDHVQAVLERLLASGFHGVVEIRSIPGRFCLQGNGEALALAAAETSYARCDQIGNPLDPAGPAARESVAFANMLAALHSRAGGALEVQLMAGSAEEIKVAYPPVNEQLTAGEWNRAAAANNRIEMRWRTTP
jgi:CheY-like chemotaxis protein